jgi:hypothetical protein
MKTGINRLRICQNTIKDYLKHFDRINENFEQENQITHDELAERKFEFGTALKENRRELSM